MTFYNFMVRNYLGENTPEGDLAEDIHRKKDTFPRNGQGKFNGWYKLIRDYLVRHNACQECLAVFEECWEEYVAYEKKKPKIIGGGVHAKKA